MFMKLSCRLLLNSSIMYKAWIQNWKCGWWLRCYISCFCQIMWSSSTLLSFQNSKFTVILGMSCFWLFVDHLIEALATLAIFICRITHLKGKPSWLNTHFMWNQCNGLLLHNYLIACEAWNSKCCAVQLWPSHCRSTTIYIHMFIRCCIDCLNVSFDVLLFLLLFPP